MFRTGFFGFRIWKWLWNQVRMGVRYYYCKNSFEGKLNFVFEKIKMKFWKISIFDRKLLFLRHFLLSTKNYIFCAYLDFRTKITFFEQISILLPKFLNQKLPFELNRFFHFLKISIFDRKFNFSYKFNFPLKISSNYVLFPSLHEKVTACLMRPK